MIAFDMALSTLTNERRTATRNIVFAAPADDPRARRPVDVAALVISVVATLVLAWLYRAGAAFDTRVLVLFSGQIPGWLSGVATIVYIAGGLYAATLIISIVLYGHGRGSIARDMVLASLLAFAGVIAASYLAGPEFPDVVPELLERHGFPSFPVVRLTGTVAALRVAGPYLSVPMRKVGVRVVIGMSLAAMVLSYGTVSAVLGGLALGVAASSAIHVLFGSGQGIPSRARITAALDEIDIEVADLEYLPARVVGATLVRVEQVSGDDLLVKVYGRDAADSAFAARLWRAIWFRDAGHSIATSSQQLAEHESLVLLMCERAGLDAQRVLGWTRSLTDDTIVVTRWLDGVPMSSTTADDLDDAALDRVWAAMGDLHEAGISHGAIEGDRVMLVGDTAAFVQFDAARAMANDTDRRRDRAQLLAATAVVVGNDRAIGAARRQLGDDGLGDVLPLLQMAALSNGLQRDVRQAGVKMNRLRSDTAAALGVKAPDTAQLQRVSWGSVAMVALTLFAAYSLITSLAEIGFDTIVDQLSNASWGWVALAFVLAQSTNLGEILTLTGVIGAPVPFGPTVMYRYAMSFISLAVPSDAGAIAMSVRYQQKLGVPPAAAVAQGPLLMLFSKGFDIILLLISARIVGGSFDTEDVDFGPVIKLVTLVVIAAVAAIVAVFTIPKLREKAVPRLKEGFDAIKGSVTDPERLFKIAVGTLMQKVLFALTLAASVGAYSGGLSFTEALFVNSAVSLFIGLVPVPGGIGVGEAALTAGLIAVGIPEEAAVAAAITHRMCTAYIPPVFGWWTSRWLVERDYL
jgi:uncharacterized membrane protein YbhN (UPF0104 family)